jgi:lysophospholipid acyltransferase (LPLAT)-like uncharacterized protein
MRSFLLLLASTIAPLIARAYFATVRILDDPRSRARRLGKRRAFVYAMWHAHQLVCALHYRNIYTVTLISRHRDGEFAYRIIRAFGLGAVRGSSTRGGGSAIWQLLQILAAGGEVVLTPDGPRGPRHSVKEGILFLAQKSGLPIQPVCVGLSDLWELRSWDRFRIPKPFARGYAAWGEPISVPAQMTPEEETAMLRRIGDAMEALEAEADARAREIKYGRRSRLLRSRASPHPWPPEA